MSNALAQLVQQMARGDETPWVPRAPNPTIHLGALTGVDLGRNKVNLLTNVPSMKELPAVPFLLSYTASMLPAEGDIVRYLHFGTSIMVLGRQIGPSAAVILG